MPETSAFKPLSEVANRIGGRRVEPQRFAIRCRCGSIVEGERGEEYQEYSCPVCRERLFVLPRNPRPRPDPGLFREGLRPFADRTQIATAEQPIVAEVVIAESVEVAAVRGRPARPASTVIVDEQPRRKLMTAPRIVVAGILLLVIATGYFTWRQALRSKYRGQLESATVDGMKALKAAEFERAVATLKIADNAARGLPGDTKQQRLASQLYREARIWSGLSGSPLESFMSDLDRAGESPNPDDVLGRFERDFARRTIVVDAWLLPAEPDREPARIDWTLHGETARLRLNVSPDMAAFEGIDRDRPRRVIFGATIEGLRPSPDGRGRWLIDVDPDGLVLLTVLEPFEHFGWPGDDDLAATLAGQRERLDLQPQ